MRRNANVATSTGHRQARALVLVSRALACSRMMLHAMMALGGQANGRAIVSCCPM